MGQNPRRPGFRLRWGEGERSEADESAATEAAVEQDAAAPDAPDTEATAESPEAATTAADATADAADPATTPAAEEEMPFLRDLVGAMRGVAESSRDSSLEGVRQAVEQRVAELTTTAAERTEELRRSADLDVNGIGDWERSEIERIRREAEQRREARRAELEQQLADHQAATDREVEATRGRLADHERELDAFFAQLSEITDPSAFVAAAKRMPPPPDLSKPASTRKQAAAATPATGATGEQKSATNGSPAPGPSDESLAVRLAQLDQRLAGSQPSEAPATGEAEPATKEQPAAEATTPAAQAAPAAAATAPPAAAGAATAVETSTAIVVKGLGSFGAITSFKQALERVDGIRGVTLSLGPTGDFVYRASHAADFDILGAIRTIEGPNTGIEQTDGSVVVTIARPR